MARIDTTELLTDPDFVDQIVIINRVSVVNTLGQNMTKETAINSVGSIQPTDGPTMKRLPQSLQNQNTSTFWVRADLSDIDNCKYPPVIVFRGKRFQVKQVFDWNNWGTGWSEGICVAEALS